MKKNMDARDHIDGAIESLKRIRADLENSPMVPHWQMFCRIWNRAASFQDVRKAYPYTSVPALCMRAIRLRRKGFRMKNFKKILPPARTLVICRHCTGTGIEGEKG